MEIINKLTELNIAIDSNIKWAGICLVAIVVLLVVLKFFTGMMANDSSDKGSAIAAGVIGLAILGVSITAGYLVYDMTKMEKQVSSLEEEFYPSLTNERTIKIQEILKVEQAADYLCPHVKLNGAKKCTYLEFISNGEITQAFVPLDNSTIPKSEKGYQLRYLDLTAEEKNFLNNHMSIVEIDVDERLVQRDFIGYQVSKIGGEPRTPFIKKDNWALGFLVVSE